YPRSVATPPPPRVARPRSHAADTLTSIAEPQSPAGSAGPGCAPVTCSPATCTGVRSASPDSDRGSYSDGYHVPDPDDGNPVMASDVHLSRARSGDVAPPRHTMRRFA